jgi:hypothetical protein
MTEREEPVISKMEVVHYLSDKKAEKGDIDLLADLANILFKVDSQTGKVGSTLSYIEKAYTQLKQAE